MTICAISHKTCPGEQWPPWRSIWYFESELPITHGNCLIWAGDLLWVEKTLSSAAVIFGPISFHNPNDSGEVPDGHVIDGSRYDNIPYGGSGGPGHWNRALRLQGGRAVGRSVNWMLRGCLDDVDVISAHGGRVGLKNRGEINARLAYGIARGSGTIWPSLRCLSPSGTWPILGTNEIIALNAGGVSTLNAARRAVSRQLANSLAVHQAILGMVELWLLKWTPGYELWYEGQPFPFNPAQLWYDALDLVGVAGALASKMIDYLTDCDPDTDGDQVPTERYLWTGAALKQVATKLKEKAHLAETTIQTVPIGEADGGFYVDSAGYLTLWDTLGDLFGAIAAPLAYDWDNSTLASSTSTLRQGYIILNPEVGPSDG